MWSRASQTGEEELIGVDWAFCGIGALGNDLGGLVGTSMFFFEYSPNEAERLEAALLDGYMAGLADNGIVVDARLVRLGYLQRRGFILTNRPSTNVAQTVLKEVEKLIPEKRRRFAFLSYCSIGVTNEMDLFAPREDMPVWESLVRKADGP